MYVCMYVRGIPYEIELIHFHLFCLQTALNIVKLGPGLAEVKSLEHNAFVIITSKKEYR